MGVAAPLPLSLRFAVSTGIQVDLPDAIDLIAGAGDVELLQEFLVIDLVIPDIVGSNIQGKIILQ